MPALTINYTKVTGCHFCIALILLFFSCGKKNDTGVSSENLSPVPNSYLGKWKAVSDYKLENGKLKIVPPIIKYYIIYKRDGDKCLELQYEGEGNEYKAEGSEFNTRLALFDSKSGHIHTKSLYEVKAQPNMRYESRKKIIRNDTLFVSNRDENTGSTAYIKLNN